MRGNVLKAPFPYFGGKSKVAPVVWQYFGNVNNYVEPFCGSLAVLLGRPTKPKVETVNDIDCYIANFWRATGKDPEKVAHYASWPVNEADLHARHTWLHSRTKFRERMKTDPDYYSCKIAGWWVWGQCCWIGSGWCSITENPSSKRPHLCGIRGIQKSMPRLSTAMGQGVNSLSRQMPCMNTGRGIHRQRPHLTTNGQDSLTISDGNDLVEYFLALRERLKRVRVCCGNWDRILGPAVTTGFGSTAVFLDPPYAKQANRTDRIYSNDSLTVANDVRKWAVEHGEDKNMRIALCGYTGEHDMPGNWYQYKYSVTGGFAGQSKKDSQAKKNRHREVIWISPNCVKQWSVFV